MPLVTRAQLAGKIPTVGVLRSGQSDQNILEFFKEFRELGYEDGRNVGLVTRSAETRLELLPQLAVELVKLKVDVIVSFDTPTTRAAIAATNEIPIVMSVGDAVATGFVSNLSRPGRNVTGFTYQQGDLAAKRLQLFKDAVPTLRRVAVLFNSTDPVTAPQIQGIERAAPQLSVEVRFFLVRSLSSLDPSFNELVDWGADAVLLLPGQTNDLRKSTADRSLKERLPAMVSDGLIWYRPDASEQNRHVAIYVDKILKGAKPGDLPVQQPTKFVLAINLKIARALGITIPPVILSRADEIIE